MVQFDNVAFSEIAGFISIACWMVVGFPQLYKNYKRKSGDSVSLYFIFIWFLGDLFNLFGAIFQELLLTVILIAIYHSAIDFLIILQIYYYRCRKTHINDEELEPLQPVRSDSSSTSQESIRRSRVIEFFELLAGLIGVCIGGYIMYYFSTLVRDNNDGNDDQKEMKVLPQILGWCSAMLYLGARIPQIIQNHKSQSTEGLSLAMFCFCVLGNVSFCVQILVYSLDPKYLLINLPWLLGNGGTLLFDFSILAQFYFYRNNFKNQNQ